MSRRFIGTYAGTRIDELTPVDTLLDIIEHLGKRESVHLRELASPEHARARVLAALAAPLPKLDERGPHLLVGAIIAAVCLGLTVITLANSGCQL